MSPCDGGWGQMGLGAAGGAEGLGCYRDHDIWAETCTRQSWGTNTARTRHTSWAPPGAQTDGGTQTHRQTKKKMKSGPGRWGLVAAHQCLHCAAAGGRQDPPLPTPALADPSPGQGVPAGCRGCQQGAGRASLLAGWASHQRHVVILISREAAPSTHHASGN